MNKDMSLGRLLGQREAFSVIAARCSAADAALLQKIRREKLYLDYAEDWKEFCVTYLHMSHDAADRIIRLLEEFGVAYFEVYQLTRISASTYRLIAPSIRDEALHHNGEAIALIPENAERVAAAVAALRKAAATVKPAPEPEAPPADLLEALEAECRSLSRSSSRRSPTPATAVGASNSRSAVSATA